jgi:hypothetical protein
MLAMFADRGSLLALPIMAAVVVTLGLIRQVR